MNFKALSRVAVMAAGLALAASVAGAAEPANQHIPLQKTIGKPMTQAPVPSLGVLNAGGATLEGNKLTLTGVSGNVIVFADRPVRAAGPRPMPIRSGRTPCSWFGARMAGCRSCI